MTKETKIFCPFCKHSMGVCKHCEGTGDITLDYFIELIAERLHKHSIECMKAQDKND